MALLFIVDILTIIFDSYLALIIRFKIDYSWVPEEYMSSVDSYVVINVVTTLVIFLLLNLYNRVWSYASMHEAVLIVGASLLSTAFQALGMSFLSVSYTHLDVYKRQKIRWCLKWDYGLADFSKTI